MGSFAANSRMVRMTIVFYQFEFRTFGFRSPTSDLVNFHNLTFEQGMNYLMVLNQTADGSAVGNCTANFSGCF